MFPKISNYSVKDFVAKELKSEEQKSAVWSFKCQTWACYSPTKPVEQLNALDVEYLSYNKRNPYVKWSIV